MRGDDYLSSQPIARLLKRRNPEGQRATSTLPYSVLLRMGFTKPAGLPTAGALLPHLSTLTTCVAVSFSMALSLGSLPPDVIRHPALRSSDFPHALRPAIIFPARVLQYSMETGFFQEKDKIGSGLAPWPERPLITRERGSAGSTDSEGSTGAAHFVILSGEKRRMLKNGLSEM